MDLIKNYPVEITCMIGIILLVMLFISNRLIEHAENVRIAKENNCKYIGKVAELKDVVFLNCDGQIILKSK